MTAVSRDLALTSFFKKKPLEHDPRIDPKDMLSRPYKEPSKTMMELVAAVRLLRLDPDAMRQPTNLIAQGSPLEYTPQGRGPGRSVRRLSF